MRRKGNPGYPILVGALLVAATAAIPARGQDADDLKRGVARISLMDNEVSVRRGDSGEWVAGVINAPLLTDDRIATGQNSRAEVQFDSANLLRMGGNAEIHLAQMEAGVFRIEIARGTVTYRVVRPSTANVEVNTPSVSIRPVREGSFRFSVNESGESEITARAGDVEVFTPKGSQWVYAGQTMLARGDAADPEFQMVGGIPVDDWDRWNDSRDRPLQSSTSIQYVPQGVYGAEDLDAAGTWTYIAPYGYCWRPTVVAAGWAPYHSGRWVWLDWYGWTWVSYDPWGWAPYHYGRWFFDVRLGWNWYPGLIGVRHYWSPALVGFFGYGGGREGAGFGFGNIGWVPLAPYETLHPWWGRGYSDVNRVNITTLNVTNVYRNARVANGISGVRTEDFNAGRFNSINRVSSNQMQQAGLVTGRVPLTPTAASRHFSDRTVANPPRASANTQFFSRQGMTGAGTAARTSTPAAQAPYRRFGEPGNQANQSRPAPAVGNAPQAAQHQGSFQRFGQPGSSQPAPRNPAPSQGAPGWSRFGNQGGNNTPAPRPQSNPPSRSAPSYTPARPAPSAPSRPAPSAPSRSAPSSGGHAAPAPSGGGNRAHR